MTATARPGALARRGTGLSETAVSRDIGRSDSVEEGSRGPGRRTPSFHQRPEDVNLAPLKAGLRPADAGRSDAATDAQRRANRRFLLRPRQPLFLSGVDPEDRKSTRLNSSH